MNSVDNEVFNPAGKTQIRKLSKEESALHMHASWFDAMRAVQQ